MFIAHKKTDNKEYAVKRISVPNTTGVKDHTTREVEALAHLEHPNIVRYYAAWFETPPSGWQKQQDAYLLADLDTSDLLEEQQQNTLSVTKVSHTRQFPDAISTDDSSAITDLRTVPNTLSNRNTTSTELSDSVDIVFEDSTSQQGNNVQPNANATHYGDSSISLSYVPPVKEGNPVATVSSPLDDNYQAPPVAPELYLYIQMELCRRTLREWLASNTLERDHEHVFDIFFQIVNAVHHVHERKLIHRDLKPSNIFFATDGTVRVGDFGLVAAIEQNKEDKQQLKSVESMGTDEQQQQQQHTAFVGTRPYMSPEQLRGHDYDAKVDMFGLGANFTGTALPFQDAE